MTDYPSPSILQYKSYFTEPGDRLGATYVPGLGTYFRIWAPNANRVSISFKNGEKIPLEGDKGYFTGRFDVEPGTQYRYHIHDLHEISDPASRYLPEGITGPSEVVNPNFDWSDKDWKGVPLDETVFYELHTGAFSADHNFEGIIKDLPRLQKLGITTIELMPVCQCPGERNWGYDGVFFHSVQNNYGRPDDLKRLVDACHGHGLAIILDVVYNHVGPEGSVLPLCGPYHTDKYHSAWGCGLNYDGDHSDDVRRYFLQAVWDWLVEFHFDGLRFDAVHMIKDDSPLRFLQEITLLAKEAEEIRGMPLLMVAESDKNDPTILWPVDRNGLGMHAHWADDFHHALHATLTGQKDGYYADYGGVPQLMEIYRDGVAFQGEYSPQRNRRHGRSYAGIDKKSLVVESQNHDQVGNRPLGERLIALTDLKTAKFAAACVFLSPFTPLIFMGEEVASRKPFYYFTDYYDTQLTKAVEQGRKKEWESFASLDDMKDSGEPETFLESVLTDLSPDQSEEASEIFGYYQKLISLSKRLRKCGLKDVQETGDGISLHYSGQENIDIILNFSERTALVNGKNIIDTSYTEQPEQRAANRTAL